jgi:glycosyltransferase involved in cell wall biosynthesis
MSAATRPPVSVIVPTRDRPDMLERCLGTVFASIADGDEVVVVDSASTDPEVALTAARAGARVLRCDRPGVDRARNAGWRATTHDLVLFVDDDVMVDVSWADALAAPFAAHPEVAFVTGRIDVPQGQEDVDRPVAIKSDEQPAVLHADTPGTLGHSASLAVRRSALEAIGGFDEQLGAGARFQSAPEVDLFDRLFTAGYVGRYEPTARAWHDQWRGRTDKVHLDWRYGVGTGARLVKLLRSDRPKARAIAVDAVWRRGLVGAARDLRAGYQLGAATRLALAAGTVVGFARAAFAPVRDGHFGERRWRP